MQVKEYRDEAKLGIIYDLCVSIHMHRQYIILLQVS